MNRGLFLVSTLVIVAIVILASMLWNAIGLYSEKITTVTKTVIQRVHDIEIHTFTKEVSIT